MAIERNNILYVLHSGLGGGTYYSTLDLIKNLNDNFEAFILGAEDEKLILYKYEQNELKIIETFPRRIKWSPKIFHDSWLTYIYYEILINYNIKLVHIMHLIYHTFDLPQIAKKLNIKTILTFHDFYFICPNYVLLNENEEYCELHCSKNNKNCKLEWNLFDEIHFKTILPTWRNEVKKLFGNIDIFISMSDIVKKLYLTIYEESNILKESNFHIIEHGRDFLELSEQLYEIPSKNNPLKIVLPATHINNIKGLKIVRELKKLDENNELEFHFLGDSTDIAQKYGKVHGSYKREDFNKIIKLIKPSFIGIFSIWPETFCYTLSEAWSCGIPTIGTNIGVIEDRINKTKGGFTIDRYDLKSSYTDIVKFKNETNHENYLNLVNNVSKINLKTTLEMTNEYLNIYDSLLYADKG